MRSKLLWVGVILATTLLLMGISLGNVSAAPKTPAIRYFATVAAAQSAVTFSMKATSDLPVGLQLKQVYLATDEAHHGQDSVYSTYWGDDGAVLLLEQTPQNILLGDRAVDVSVQGTAASLLTVNQPNGNTVRALTWRSDGVSHVLTAWGIGTDTLLEIANSLR